MGSIMILLVLLWLWWKTTQLLMKLLARDCSSSVAVQEDVRAIGAGMEPRRKVEWGLDFSFLVEFIYFYLFNYFVLKY